MVKKRYWFLVPAWAIIILILCGMPPKDVDEIKMFDFPFQDKIVHFGLYFVLAELIMAVLMLNTRLRQLRWASYAIAILSCLLYGWLIEVMQQNFFPGRSYELMDVVADTAGAVLGVLLYSPISQLIGGKKKEY
jgi:VanZ family protein